MRSTMGRFVFRRSRCALSKVLGGLRLTRGAASKGAGVPLKAQGVVEVDDKHAVSKLPWRYPMPERLVAIGDVHGNAEAIRALLRRVGVLGEGDRWTGGDTVVVQVGDVLDRNDGELETLKLLFRLQDEAPLDGGRVHLLLGNHEVHNVRQIFKYVTDCGFADFERLQWSEAAIPERYVQKIEGMPLYKRPRAMALAPGGVLARELGLRAQVAIAVGDSVFVHAGLSTRHLGDDADRSLCELNEQTALFLMGKGDVPRLLVDEVNGPLWMRAYSDSVSCYRRHGLPNATVDCKMLKRTLRMIGAKRMVVGHTAQPVINAVCQGSIWRIDTGLFDDGHPEALEILRDGQLNVITMGDVVDGHMRVLNLPR